MSENDDWESHWQRYARAASQNPAQRLRHRLVVRLLRSQGVGGGSRVLDLGSGQGDLAVKVRQRFPQAELLGLELSAEGVALSRRKVPEAEFIVADLFHPPPALLGRLGWASHAVCSEVLEHVDAPADFLRATSPYLAPGGRIILTVPGGPISAFDRHIGHRQHFTRDSIAEIMRRAGFEVSRVYLSGFPFFNLYRAIVIARGGQLAADVETGRRGLAARLAGVVMAAFRLLFHFTWLDSPWGWQVIAVGRKPG